MPQAAPSSPETAPNTGIDLESLTTDVVALAIKAGASDAEAVAREGDEFSVNVRMGDVETLKESGSRGLGLRVFLGKRSASASTSDLTADGIRQLVEGAMALVNVTEEDPLNGLPETSEFGSLNERSAPLLRRRLLALGVGAHRMGPTRRGRCPGRRSAHHQLRRRQLRCRYRSHGARQLARLCRRLPHQLRRSFGRPPGHGRKRPDAARRLVVQRSPPCRSRVTGVHRPGSRPPHSAPPRRSSRSHPARAHRLCARSVALTHREHL